MTLTRIIEIRVPVDTYRVDWFAPTKEGQRGACQSGSIVIALPEPDHSVVLHCDGPDKGKDTRTLREIQIDDTLHAIGVRLAKLEDKVNEFERLATPF
jgi:hypothetical protein